MNYTSPLFQIQNRVTFLSATYIRINFKDIFISWCRACRSFSTWVGAESE